MYCIFMRHGESEGNERGIIQGRFDQYGLTAKGKKQVESAIHSIRQYQPALILTSPLKRAYETALIAKAGLWDIPLLIHQDLVEIGMGSLEGISKEEKKRKYQNEYQRLKASNYDYSIVQGEPQAEVMKRVDAFIKEMNTFEKNLLIVSHKGFILNLLERLSTSVYQKPICDNGSIFVIKKEHRRSESSVKIYNNPFI